MKITAPRPSWAVVPFVLFIYHGTIQQNLYLNTVSEIRCIAAGVEACKLLVGVGQIRTSLHSFDKHTHCAVTDYSPFHLTYG